MTLCDWFSFFYASNQVQTPVERTPFCTMIPNTVFVAIFS